MTAKKSDKPTVDFTLEQLEREVATDVEPLRMGVRGKVIELRSMQDMGLADLEALLAVMSADQDSLVGELGEAGMVMRVLPAMIGEDNYEIVRDAGITLKGLMKLFGKIQEYYEGQAEQLGVDPKDSTSQ